MALVLENTFTTMGSMVDQHMAHLKWFKSFLLRNKWPSIDRIVKVTRPVLFIYGEKDEIIDNRNMLELYKAAEKTAYKQLYMVAGGDHNTCYFYGGFAYLHTISTFISKVLTEHPLVVENHPKTE